MGSNENTPDEGPDAVDFGIEWISKAGDSVELNRRERAQHAQG